LLLGCVGPTSLAFKIPSTFAAFVLFPCVTKKKKINQIKMKNQRNKQQKEK
jgi:hypothetical protein